MNEIVRIEGTEIEKIYYNGQPVITLSMVDKLHQKPEGSARRNFNNNRDKFILGEDYYNLPYEEWSTLTGKNLPDQRGNLPVQKGGRRGNMAFFTQIGYAVLATTFTDELSFSIRREMARRYFKFQELLEHVERNAETESLKDELLETQKKYIALLLERKRRPNKPITDEEKHLMTEMYAEGLSFGEIARRLDRARSGVSNYLNYGSTSGRLKQNKN